MATNNDSYPFNVYWTVPEVSVKADHVRQQLVAHGFSEDEIVEPSMRTHTARCVKSFHNLRGASKTLADAAGETETEAVYSLLDRASGNATEKVSYDEDTRIVYDKISKTVSATGRFANQFFDRLNSEYIGRYQSDDFRSWILALVDKCAGIPKRPTGGIYLVPGRFRTAFEQARDFLRDVAPGADIYIERVFMGDEETKNIRMSVNEFVSNRLDELEEKASAYKRESAFGHLKDATNRLSEITTLFSEALDIQALTDDVASRVSSIGDTLNDAMANIASEKSAKVAAAAPSKTPLEVASKVAEVLETMDNGTADIETVGVILKGEGFVGKPSTVLRRVQKAIDDGFIAVKVIGNNFVLASAAPAAAEVENGGNAVVNAESLDGNAEVADEGVTA